MRNKRNIIILFIVNLLILISIFFFIFNKNKVDTSIIKKGVLNGINEEEVLNMEVDPTKVFFEINSEPHFENGNSEGNLRIANPPYNAYDLSFTITLDDTKEVIFESGVIEPYEYIENAKLNKVLSGGKYEATAIIDAYDKETKKVINTVAAKLTIMINE